MNCIPEWEHRYIKLTHTSWDALAHKWRLINQKFSSLSFVLLFYRSYMSDDTWTIKNQMIFIPEVSQSQFQLFSTQKRSAIKMTLIGFA